MQSSITKRQKQILAALVEQYAEVASPVGSSLLAKLFKVSSATIRSELVHLERLGLIYQPHTSAGRIPTDKGYRYYVNNFSDAFCQSPSQINRATDESNRVEMALRSRVLHSGLPERAIRNAVDTLVELTQNLGLATIGNQLYMNGLSNLFSQPEFSSQHARPHHIQEVAGLLDNIEPWLREVAPNDAISVYIGNENPIGRNAECSLVIAKYISPYSDNSYIGVLGPTRQSYNEVIKLVQKASEAIEEVL
jgi:heat-inducible transcriptional repressor